MCAITLFVCQIIIIIIYIYLEYFMLEAKMNFDKNFREIDNTNIYLNRELKNKMPISLCPWAFFLKIKG